MGGAVRHMAQRVDAQAYVMQALGLRIARKEVGIHEVEVGVKGNQVHLANK